MAKVTSPACCECDALFDRCRSVSFERKNAATSRSSAPRRSRRTKVGRRRSAMTPISAVYGAVELVSVSRHGNHCHFDRWSSDKVNNRRWSIPSRATGNESRTIAQLGDSVSTVCSQLHGFTCFSRVTRGNCIRPSALTKVGLFS